jgi:hypothetical protein
MGRKPAPTEPRVALWRLPPPSRGSPTGGRGRDYNEWQAEGMCAIGRRVPSEVHQLVLSWHELGPVLHGLVFCLSVDSLKRFAVVWCCRPYSEDRYIVNTPYRLHFLYLAGLKEVCVVEQIEDWERMTTSYANGYCTTFGSAGSTRRSWAGRLPSSVADLRPSSCRSILYPRHPSRPASCKGRLSR